VEQLIEVVVVHLQYFQQLHLQVEEQVVDFQDILQLYQVDQVVEELQIVVQ
jgi:hypothetical protein